MLFFLCLALIRFLRLFIFVIIFRHARLWRREHGRPEEQRPHQPPDDEHAEDVQAHGAVVVDEAGADRLGAAVAALGGRGSDGAPQEARPVHEEAEDDGAGDGAEAAEEDGLEAEGQRALGAFHRPEKSVMKVG